jgi:hypothetical protein
MCRLLAGAQQGGNFVLSFIFSDECFLHVYQSRRRN